MPQDANVKIKIGVEGDAETQRKLNSLGQNVNNLSGTFKKAGTVMLGMGTALAGGMAAMTTKWAEAGDEVAKMSKRTGWAVESLSELRHVAEISGTELDAFEKGTRRLSKAIVDASEGGTTYERALNRIGLTGKELIGLGIEDQFWKVAEALAETEDETIKAASAQELLGRTGTQIFPMLSEGADGIRQLRDEAHELGIVFSDETAADAEAFMDAMSNVKSSLQGLGAQVAQQLGPELTNMADKITGMVVKFKEWAAAHPELVTWLKALVAILVGGGGLLIAVSQVSKAISGIGAAAGALKGIGGMFGGMLGPIMGIVAGLGMMAFGIKGLIDQHKAEEEALAMTTQLQEEYTKMLAGEENQYYELAAAAEASGMVLSKEAKLLLDLKREYQKALEGEHAGYVQVLKDAEAMGAVLTVEQKAYIAEVEAMEEEKKAIEAANKAREESIRLRKEELKAFQDWLQAQPGGKGGFSEEEWAAVLPAVQAMKQAELKAQGRNEEIAGQQVEGVNNYPGQEVPELAQGALVTKPTLALVGEKGTEAVVPLESPDRMTGGGILPLPGGIMGGAAEPPAGSNINLYFNYPVVVQNEEAMRQFSEIIYEYIKMEQRYNLGGAYSG